MHMQLCLNDKFVLFNKNVCVKIFFKKLNETLILSQYQRLHFKLCLMFGCEVHVFVSVNLSVCTSV